jgi:cytidylate kinase
MPFEGFVLVSGLPASGKTAVGRLVAKQLKIPFLDKDDILESEFDEHHNIDPKLRTTLSRKSDRSFERRARELKSGILISFWRPIGHSVSYGTSTGWVHQFNESVIELHCKCRPDVALKRFHERERHKGHNDAARSGNIAQQMQELALIGPLGAWPCYTIDTSDLTCIKELAKEASKSLKSLLAAHG